jgi:GrpB-like predicted nucleotidyltransferase (UPF0157 family)
VVNPSLCGEDVTTRTGKPIIIAAYDPAWRERFDDERAILLRACESDAFVRIEHVGSTSVPGLAAKPIVDIMPGVRSLDAFAPLIPRVESLAYEYVPEYEHDGPAGEGMPERRYFRKDVGGERAFHLHVVETGGEFWRRHLLFRDYLRAHPDAAREYERLKRDIAARYNANLGPASDTNRDYTGHKTDFITAIEKKARAFFGEARE